MRAESDTKPEETATLEEREGVSEEEVEDVMGEVSEAGGNEVEKILDS